MVRARFIKAPDPGTISALARRMAPEARSVVTGRRYDAVGLVQAHLPDLFYYMDEAVKASSVYAVEISGNCPQQISMIALFGDTESVRHALATLGQLTKED